MTLVLTWCLSGAVYLLFAGQVSADEVATAVVLATLATVWSVVIRRCSQVHFGHAPHLTAALLRAMRDLMPAAMRVGLILVRSAGQRASPGRAVRAAFAPGRAGDPAARTRRAVALLAASLAPDRLVIATDANEAHLHVLGELSHAPDARWLT